MNTYPKCRREEGKWSKQSKLSKAHGNAPANLPRTSHIVFVKPTAPTWFYIVTLPKLHLALFKFFNGWLEGYDTLLDDRLAGWLGGWLYGSN